MGPPLSLNRPHSIAELTSDCTALSLLATPCHLHLHCAHTRPPPRAGARPRLFLLLPLSLYQRPKSPTSPAAPPNPAPRLTRAGPGVEWDTLLFFAALFVIVEGLGELGLLRFVADTLGGMIAEAPLESRQYFAIVLILWSRCLPRPLSADPCARAPARPVVLGCHLLAWRAASSGPHRRSQTLDPALTAASVDTDHEASWPLADPPRPPPPARPPAHLLPFSAGSAIFSAFVDNIPFTATMVPILKQVRHIYNIIPSYMVPFLKQVPQGLRPQPPPPSTHTLKVGMIS
jgi:hypothetical protein